MPRYEWRGTSPFHDNRNGRVIAPGETADLAARIADPHPEFVAVDVEADESTTHQSDESTNAVRDAVSFDPSDHTVDEIRDLVADVDSDDELATLADLERDGKQRTTALEAIDRARD